MVSADDQGRVILIHERDDAVAQTRIVAKLRRALGEQAVVEAVDNSAAARALLERQAASGEFVAAAVCASDAATATTLIWELAEPDTRSPFGTRVVVVLESWRGLPAVPDRLLDAFEFISLDQLGDERAIAAVLERLAGLEPAPRPVDPLASVFRSAIARRSPDALAAISASLDRIIELDARELVGLARVGDEGPRPNPLWSRWVSHERTVTIAEPPALASKPSKPSTSSKARAKPRKS